MGSKLFSAAAWSELALHLDNLFFFFVAPFLVQIAFILLLVVAAKKFLPAVDHSIVPTALIFSIAGIVIGYFVGASREPVVAATLPAILTLVGAIVAFAFGKDSLVELRPAAGYAIAAMMLGALSGTVHGQSVRKVTIEDERLRTAQKEAADRKHQEWQLMYEKLELPLTLELLRKQAGLSQSQPAQ